MNFRGFPMLHTLVTAGAVVWTCFVPINAGAVEQRVDCPLWLKPDAFKAHSSPKGWTAVMPQSWRLDGGGLLHGAPDEGGYLKPDQARIEKTGDRETGTMRWTLGPLPHAHETWLYCGYGPLQLFMRVSVDAIECTATVNSERGAFVGTGFVCK